MKKYKSLMILQSIDNHFLFWKYHLFMSGIMFTNLI